MQAARQFYLCFRRSFPDTTADVILMILTILHYGLKIGAGSCSCAVRPRVPFDKL
jgi:hypothetical protein